jgi:hypothetical protein
MSTMSSAVALGGFAVDRRIREQSDSERQCAVKQTRPAAKQIAR